MITKPIVAIACAIVLAGAAPIQSGGDLLVAPTRVLLTPGSGGEVVVSNKSDQPATYRISLVLRRMDNAGQLIPIDEATASPMDAAALELINYAPRRVELAPRESQTVRIGVRVPPTLAPGEYRAHLLFRAVPRVEAAEAVAAAPAGEGMSISLRPIYGVTIPVIVRVGVLDGVATLENARVVSGAHPQLSVELVRSGQRSVYGRLELMAAGSKEPVATIGGVAAYPEVNRRTVVVPLPADVASKVRTGLTVRFTETDPAGTGAEAIAPVTIAAQ